MMSLDHFSGYTIAEDKEGNAAERLARFQRLLIAGLVLSLIGVAAVRGGWL